MNEITHPVAAEPVAFPDYHKDGYGWAIAQAAIIRAGRLDSIDWENVAEEIESVGKQERHHAEMALSTYLLARIKWDLQPMFRCDFLAEAIVGLLADYDSIIAENLSLKLHADEMLSSAYQRARADAAIETGFDHDAIPVESPLWTEIRSAPVPRRKV